MSSEGKDTMSFSGMLKSHKISPLRDIAWTQDLSEDGTRDEIIKRITAFLDDPANSHLRKNKRYIALFTSKRALGKRPGLVSSEDEDAAEPLTQLVAWNPSQTLPFYRHHHQTWSLIRLVSTTMHSRLTHLATGGYTTTTKKCISIDKSLLRPPAALLPDRPLMTVSLSLLH
ncbi:hypothetical protein PAXRUDRAFT_562638 [Paxillus rubicundulus Ve08.2h10]|uniref:SAP domain-containing protein n=1 Tax=Paxillus rubicundulus Ve08.2h10 TaxID=930991 RepID=A0A0D0DZM7_9AGAM|nr:hypothetical protein PAXRUDRAFT_562638 [Paxillus rubicundulus Ve08.2h10]